MIRALEMLFGAALGGLVVLTCSFFMICLVIGAAL